jgi:hypothetical protein
LKFCCLAGKRKTPPEGGVVLSDGYFDLVMAAATVASAASTAVASASRTATTVTSTKGRVTATSAYVTAASIRWSCSASAI